MDPSMLARTSSNLSTVSSQTAQDYIASQLSLEADAREALPYQFDTCTYPLGPLRQSVYACLTCTPPPASIHQQFTPAGICYSCSISCHGEHNLVELFSKRDFACDCGTTRLSNSSTGCSLRHNAATGRKGGVTGEKAREGNKYNQNYKGKFCGCGGEYDPEKEKGTMFQCMGLGTVDDGGCGEDWWHPECLLGLPRMKHEERPKVETSGALETVNEEAEGEDGERATNEVSDGEHLVHDDAPLPEGFPDEDDFDHLICYKCVNAFPWIRAYADSPGFLIAKQSTVNGINGTNGTHDSEPASPNNETSTALKRKAEDSAEDEQEPKKPRSEPSTSLSDPLSQTDDKPYQPPKHTLLSLGPSTPKLSLFLTENFRSALCRCPTCFPALAKHPQLLEEETSYSPPLSSTSASDAGDDRGETRSIHSGGSLLERGEAALSSMDRVRAIEGVMAYNHVRDKVKDFLKPFAESGQAVGAEDIKAYFAKLRGDEMAGREGVAEGEGIKGDGRREQGGY